MILALFEPDIPQNTGSLIRLAACMGIVLHIIEPCGFPLDHKRLRRVAMDYLDLAAIERHSSWAQFMESIKLKKNNRVILLTTKAAKNYTEFAFAPDDILLLGRETSGVPKEVHAAADARVKIPLQPHARSLNMALAAGMVLGEALRQTKGFPA
jgi:tRNA (cytidine/uridine-2'-O-)-methyltransferase